jgi:hypothetical protein
MLRIRSQHQPGTRPFGQPGPFRGAGLRVDRDHDQTGPQAREIVDHEPERVRQGDQHPLPGDQPGRRKPCRRHRDPPVQLAPGQFDRLRAWFSHRDDLGRLLGPGGQQIGEITQSQVGLGHENRV